VTVIVRTQDGAVWELPKGDRWTEPPAQPSTVPGADYESLYVVVYQGDRKIASFNPAEVLAVYSKDDVEPE
jgi:hypothetical protein